MKVFERILLTLTISMLVFALAAPAYAQDKKMSMDEYKQQLADWQKREADAKAAIAGVDAELAALNTQMADLDQQIATEWDNIYSLLGTDRAGVDSYRSQLKALESRWMA